VRRHVHHAKHANSPCSVVSLALGVLLVPRAWPDHAKRAKESRV
jgi:hypothetical protein